MTTQKTRMMAHGTVKTSLWVVIKALTSNNLPTASSLRKTTKPKTWLPLARPTMTWKWKIRTRRVPMLPKKPERDTLKSEITDLNIKAKLA
jgi:hypothetical protein